MAKPVETVSITGLTPLFKDGEEANSIQLAKFRFSDGSECGFSVVVQKGLYVAGSQVVYIQPDYCLPENELFSSFTAPGGDPKKSRLGRQNRIRAIKFNFGLKDSMGPIYSNGILMPLSEVESFLEKSGYCFYSDMPSPMAYLEDADLADRLGVFKYEEPETAHSGPAVDFPYFLYKTDEENICNIVDHVRRVISQCQELGISIKRDGSSHTTYFKKDGDSYRVGVCSRSQEKKMNLGPAEVGEEGNSEQIATSVKENKDSWIELAKSSGVLDRGLEYCKSNNLELAFRGEIIGSGLKGSGNKLNPDSSQKQKLVLFGVDDLSGGYSVRLNGSSEHSLERICESLGFEYAKSVFVTPSTYEELCEICEGIFRSEKENGRVIEGVVVRTRYGNDLSCKVMNSEYDSRK